MCNYPYDYLSWCFNGDGTMSANIKEKQYQLMEEIAAYEESYERARLAEFVEYPSYNMNEYEPTPYYQQCTDNITRLLK